MFDVREILTEAFNRTGVEWRIKGVVNGKGNLYTLSDDTKLISKVFELVSFPIITKALEPYIHKWETEERQTVYPDLTLILSGAIPNKIAIDIGSIREVSALREGKGTFTRFGHRGKDAFEDYWRNFDRTPPRKYTNIEEYLAWRRKNPAAVADLFGNKE